MMVFYSDECAAVEMAAARVVLMVVEVAVYLDDF